MKKCDLKIGYLVKLRNGELSLVLPDINDNLILVEKIQALYHLMIMTIIYIVHQ